MRVAVPSIATDREISRFPCTRLRRVLGVFDSAGSCAPRVAVRMVLPSDSRESVGIPKILCFGAQYPAHAFPCQRFASALAGDRA